MFSGNINIKYIPGNGEFKVRASEKLGSVLIEVIPPDELPQIFHDFYHSSNVKNLSVAGLVLSIVREILKIPSGRYGWNHLSQRWTRTTNSVLSSR